MGKQLVIQSKGNLFQFYDFSYNNFNELFKFFEAHENQCRLKDEIPGFTNAVIADDGVAVTFKEILPREIEILEDGRVQVQKYWIVEEGHFAVFKNFMIPFGDGAPIKSGITEIAKFTKMDPIPAHISTEKIMKFSDQLSFIQNIDFDKMEHVKFKKAHFDGRFEAFSDVAPFNNYTSDIKSIKGVLGTPAGIRTIKMSLKGQIKISKKKEEEFDSGLYYWIYNQILKGEFNTRLDGQMTIDEVAKNG